MNIYIILLLRIIHIFAGVLWVGSAIFYLFLVQPAVKSIGSDGHKFMNSLFTRQRYPMYMGIIATLTIVSGILLFPGTSGNFNLGWIKSGPGLGFTLGSLAGIAVYFVGFLMVKPRAQRMGKLVHEIGMAGGPPTQEQLADLERGDKDLNQAERLDFVLLSVSLLLMAIARYMVF
jgi:uncharacterized membrane protein